MASFRDDSRPPAGGPRHRYRSDPMTAAELTALLRAEETEAEGEKRREVFDAHLASKFNAPMNGGSR